MRRSKLLSIILVSSLLFGTIATSFATDDIVENIESPIEQTINDDTSDNKEDTVVENTDDENSENSKNGENTDNKNNESIENSDNTNSDTKSVDNIESNSNPSPNIDPNVIPMPVDGVNTNHEHNIKYRYLDNDIHAVFCDENDCKYYEEMQCEIKDNICVKCGHETKNATVHYETAENGTHSVISGDEITTEDCTYINGVCEKCGFSQPVNKEPQPSINNEYTYEHELLYYTVVDGKNLSITAPAGVFPDNVKVDVHKIDISEKALADALTPDVAFDDVRCQICIKEQYTYDIVVYDMDGNEVQPNTEFGNVSIVFSNIDMKDDEMLATFHIDDDGNVADEEVKIANINKESNDVAIEVEHFSTYTLVIYTENYELVTSMEIPNVANATYNIADIIQSFNHPIYDKITRYDDVCVTLGKRSTGDDYYAECQPPVEVDRHATLVQGPFADATITFTDVVGATGSFELNFNRANGKTVACMPFSYQGVDDEADIVLGDGITATYDETMGACVITIADGKGNAWNNPLPPIWYKIKQNVKTIQINVNNPDEAVTIPRFFAENASELRTITGQGWDNCVKISDYAFAHTTALQMTSLPENVANIGMNAFWDSNVSFTSLSNVSVDACAFRDVKNCLFDTFTNVSIADDAFHNAICIADELTVINSSINTQAFANVSNIVYIFTPSDSDTPIVSSESGVFSSELPADGKMTITTSLPDGAKRLSVDYALYGIYTDTILTIAVNDNVHPSCDNDIVMHNLLFDEAYADVKSDITKIVFDESSRYGIACDLTCLKNMPSLKSISFPHSVNSSTLFNIDSEWPNIEEIVCASSDRVMINNVNTNISVTHQYTNGEDVWCGIIPSPSEDNRGYTGTFVQVESILLGTFGGIDYYTDGADYTNSTDKHFTHGVDAYYYNNDGMLIVKINDYIQNTSLDSYMSNLMIDLNNDGKVVKNYAIIGENNFLPSGYTPQTSKIGIGVGPSLDMWSLEHIYFKGFTSLSSYMLSFDINTIKSGLENIADFVDFGDIIHFDEYAIFYYDSTNNKNMSAFDIDRVFYMTSIPDGLSTDPHSVPARIKITTVDRKIASDNEDDEVLETFDYINYLHTDFAISEYIESSRAFNYSDYVLMASDTYEVLFEEEYIIEFNKKRNVTVKYLNYDGSEISTVTEVTCTNFHIPSQTKVPDKACNFVGWKCKTGAADEIYSIYSEDDLNHVYFEADSIELKAVYDISDKDTVHIEFYDDDKTLLSSNDYTSGEEVVIPDVPQFKQATNGKNVQFINWSPAVSKKAIADAKYYARYQTSDDFFIYYVSNNNEIITYKEYSNDSYKNAFNEQDISQFFGQFNQNMNIHDILYGDSELKEYSVGGYVIDGFTVRGNDTIYNWSDNLFDINSFEGQALYIKLHYSPMSTDSSHGKSFRCVESLVSDESPVVFDGYYASGTEYPFYIDVVTDTYCEGDYCAYVMGADEISLPMTISRLTSSGVHLMTLDLLHNPTYSQTLDCNIVFASANNNANTVLEIVTASNSVARRDGALAPAKWCCDGSTLTLTTSPVENPVTQSFSIGTDSSYTYANKYMLVFDNPANSLADNYTREEMADFANFDAICRDYATLCCDDNGDLVLNENTINDIYATHEYLQNPMSGKVYLLVMYNNVYTEAGTITLLDAEGNIIKQHKRIINESGIKMEADNQLFFDVPPRPSTLQYDYVFVGFKDENGQIIKVNRTTNDETYIALYSIPWYEDATLTAYYDLEFRTTPPVFKLSIPLGSENLVPCEQGSIDLGDGKKNYFVSQGVAKIELDETDRSFVLNMGVSVANDGYFVHYDNPEKKSKNKLEFKFLQDTTDSVDITHDGWTAKKYKLHMNKLYDITEDDYVVGEGVPYIIYSELKEQGEFVGKLTFTIGHETEW